MNGNNSDLSGMLQRVLSDPDALQNVLKLAGNLKNGKSVDVDLPEEDIVDESIIDNIEEEAEEIKEGVKNESGEAEENRIRLLCALKPYLSEERREKADVMIRILKLLRFTDLNELTGLFGGILK